MKHNSNSRTVAHLRAQRFIAQTVEQWIDHAGIRRDLFKIIDVLAARADQGILGIQATVKKDSYDHRAKVRNNPALAEWLRSGGRYQIWCWAKGLKKTREVWVPHIEEAQMDGDKVRFIPVDENWLQENAQKAA